MKFQCVILMGLAITSLANCKQSKSSGTNASKGQSTSESGDARPEGGACSYDIVEGNCVLSSLDVPSKESYSCKNNPVEVTFKFVPKDPSLNRFPEQDNYKFTVGGGMNPNKEWTEKLGMTLASKHVCNKVVIVSGACSPVVYKFPDLEAHPDYEKWNNGCF